MAQASKLITIDSDKTFKTKFTDANISHAVLFFWADWHEPCKQLTPVIEQLSIDHPHLSIFSINAEEYSDISESFNISSVPTIIFCKNGKESQKLEAVLAPDLVNAVSVFSKQAATQQKLLPNKNNNKNDKNKTNDNSQNDSKSQKNENNNDNNDDNNNNNNKKNANDELNERLAKLVKAAPVMLFMKGSPDAPRCKFSRAMIETLKEQNIGKFGYFDILSDNGVREGLKTFSNWKTYPQLYINGKLIGGLDIVKEMIDDGEFKDIIPKSDENELNEKLKKLIDSKPVMLFMKGTPDNPQCGFSNKMVGLLKDNNVQDFGYFNILDDMDVRQGLKKYSNWPTYPQLYINGKLIGGLDIVQEMIDDGEFQDALP